jgi:hypothetical protein
MECKTEENQTQYCNCTYSCSKKGSCCDCLHYHRKRGELPACYFPDAVEQSYDRSIQRFIALHQ